MNAHLEPKRVVSYLFIIAIAVVFTLQFGPGSRGCEQPLTPKKSAAAAVVNGKEIPVKEFLAAYNNQLQYFKLQGNNIPASLIRQLGIPQQVLDQLVTSELLAQAADKQGIVPADAEIREVLFKIPDFQKDGSFDYQRYDQVLREYYRKRPAEYESELRRRLAAQKLLELVASGAVISDEEVKSKFLREANKADATYVRFLPTMYAAAVSSPKPQEVALFQKEHAKDIQDYYQANRFLYHTPDRVRARHILIRSKRTHRRSRRARPGRSWRRSARKSRAERTSPRRRKSTPRIRAARNREGIWASMSEPTGIRRLRPPPFRCSRVRFHNPSRPSSVCT